MDNLYGLLMDIKKRPHHYLGKKVSIEMLDMFLGGYLYYRYKGTEESKKALEAVCLDGFHEYIGEILYTRSEHGWVDLLTYFSSSEEEAWENFFRYLEAYVKLDKTEKMIANTKGPMRVQNETGEMYELLMKIKNCPPLYLGKESIERLSVFLRGYRLYRESVGIDLKKDCLNGFDDYIACKYRMDHQHSWSEILLFCCMDDRIAFYRFYEEFEQFIKQKSG